MTFSHPDYTIVRLLGRGGSASVYLAVQNNLNRRVALKIMHTAALHDPNVGKRFLREARIVAKLSHPRIVPIYEVGQPTSTHGYYLTMEYLPGGSLTTRASSLTLGDFRIVLSQIVDALSHAHDNGFVHRDVKPDNILFRSPTDALLADFGIARLSQSTTSLTATGAMIGTPDYMSPEQIQGLSVDARTDLYLLGLVIFEMLAGYRPFRGDSMMSIGFQHMTAPIPLLPVACAHFQPCINQLLAKKPIERPASARQFLRTFDSLYSSFRLSSDVPLSKLHAHGELDAVPTMPDSNISLSRSEQIVDHEPSPPRRFWSGSKKWGAALSALLILLGTGWYWQAAIIRNFSVAEKTIEPEASGTDSEDFIDADAFETTSLVSADPTTDNLTGDSASGELAESPNETESTRVGEIENKADTAFQLERWFGEEADTATRLYQQLSAIVPDSEIAKDRLAQISSTTQTRFERAIEQGDLSEAEVQLDHLRQVWPADSRTQSLAADLENAREYERRRSATTARKERVDLLLSKASAAMQARRWDAPEGENASSYYRTVLELEPDNALARSGLDTLVRQITELADQAVGNNDFAGARKLIDSARNILPDHAAIGRSQTALREGQDQYAMQQRLKEEQEAFNSEVEKLSRRVDAWLGNEAAQLDGVYAGLKDDIAELLQHSPDNVDLRRLQIATERQVSVLQRLSENEDATASDPFHIPGF